MLQTDIAIAAELLSAVQYQDDLNRRHQAEVLAARDRLPKAAFAVGEMKDRRARVEIIATVYERAQGVRHVLASLAGLSPNCLGVRKRLQQLAQRDQAAA